MTFTFFHDFFFTHKVKTINVCFSYYNNIMIIRLLTLQDFEGKFALVSFFVN